MASVVFDNVTQRSPDGFAAVTDLQLDVADGELLVVVGPPGSGTSTTFRLLAGLEDISDGKLSIGDRVVNDLEARERKIAIVLQGYALYPHLTVAGNLVQPLELARIDPLVRDQRVRDVARTLRLTELLDRLPRRLSADQRQRVAIGRAMVREPDVLLIDEPLSNVDPELRVAMCTELREHQRSLRATMICITHDQVAAATIGDRVAVLNRGVLQQVATPGDLYERPANTFVAGFIGSPPMNRVMTDLRRSGDDLLAVSGERDITQLSDDLDVIANTARERERFILGVRPEHVELTGEGKGVSAVVRLVEHVGSEQIVHVDAAGFDVHSPESPSDDDPAAPPQFLVNVREPVRLRAGDTVHLHVNRRHLHVFDAVTGAACSR